MSVNRYKLTQPKTSESKTQSINIPIIQNIGLSGKEDNIKREFVEYEVNKSINEIIDYEKVKLRPIGVNNSNVKNIRYDLNMLYNGGYAIDTYWDDIGFTYEDFLYNKNGFTKSFLRLDFFDSDKTSSQILLFFITISPKFSLNEYNGDGNPPLPSEYDLGFTLGNTLNDRNANGEGFNIYYYKDKVIPTINKELFMRASFANAKTGVYTRMMSSNNPINDIDDLMKSTNNTNEKNNLFTKYILSRNSDGYFYEIDTEYSNNVTFESENYNVNLYEISAK